MKESELFEKCLFQEIIYQGKIITVCKDKVLLPNGKTTTREVVHHPGAVGVVALKEGNLLMVKQYRYALGKETLEIPAGKLDPGEKPEVCAVRELREETGYQGEMILLGVFNTSPGFADEIIYLYQAVNLTWAPLKNDEDEFLKVSEISLPRAVEMVYSGQIQDAKSALGILLVDRKAL